MSPDQPVAHPAHRFSTVGIYVQPPTAEQTHYFDFYKDCGYNYIEYCEAGFARRPDTLDAYYADFSASVAAAQKKGFKVWILLLAGMKQWKGPAASGGGAGTFGVLETEQLNERLTFLRQAVRGLKGADGFQFFAGDPGGDPQGRATIRDCAAFARQVQSIVREEAPKAAFAVNLWAIAEWAGFPSPFTLDFWQKQVVLSKELVAEPGLLGPDCGVIFSMDNYYRSLTLTTYADGGITPELYPQAHDIRRLHDRKVKPVLGWPYFLVDECDDGFITPNNVVTKGQSQAETRYIRAIVDHGLAAGLDGLVTNASFVAAEPLNIYVFGRMCRDPKLTPGAALDEYAGLIAEDDSRAALGRVLRFIENNCNWQNSLPKQYRLRDFDVGDLTTAQAAMDLLGTVVPRKRARITLPEPPEQYLPRLRRRLETIAAGDIGGPSPHYRPQKP
ncbi:MAG: hypothetical protein FJX72_06680 [Armatimonadetes bacterium]|nr:hypothetical protein [Armatimonadota bacterium]